jgi:hypothetical protein
LDSSRTGVAGGDHAGLFARLEFSKVGGLMFFLNGESRMMAFESLR